MLLRRSSHGGVGTVLLGSWGRCRNGRACGSTRGGGTTSGSVARHLDGGVVVYLGGCDDGTSGDGMAFFKDILVRRVGTEWKCIVVFVGQCTAHLLLTAT